MKEVKVSQLPKVGQKVLVQHEVNRDKQGNVIGLRKCGVPRLATITAIYLGGQVRTGISDVWDVAMSEKGWVTVANRAA